MSSNEYMRTYMQRYSMERRDRAVALAGGKCQLCGSVEDLNFHHRDPETKSFTIASRWHRPWAQTLAEMKKCDLLCAPCHRKTHHPEPAPHGTLTRYRTCKCDECRAEKARYNKQYKDRL